MRRTPERSTGAVVVVAPPMSSRYIIIQYKLLYTISNSVEVYEEAVTRTKKIPCHVVKSEVTEENRYFI